MGRSSGPAARLSSPSGGTSSLPATKATVRGRSAHALRFVTRTRTVTGALPDARDAAPIAAESTSTPGSRKTLAAGAVVVIAAVLVVVVAAVVLVAVALVAA